MSVPPEKVLADVGRRLSEPLSKDPLVKLLKKAASALSELRQSSSLQHAIAPLSNSLVQKKLLQHKDKDVRILLAVCFSEIIRVLAPTPPFSDQILKGIFKLIISIFSELSDVENAYFGKRVKILETIAALRCCVLMLDIGCENLVLEMFNIFFSVVRDEHQQNLLQAMLSIMVAIVEEKVSKNLLDVILSNLLKEGKGGSYGSFKLAVSLVENCAERLEPHIRGFLTSCISERDATGNELKEFYHEIIFQIYQCAPQILIAVMPNLTQELLTDQVDVRIKAVHLIGKLLTHSRLQLALEYRPLFIEFLKRFSDKSSEVRSSAVDCAKACYLVKSSGAEAFEILTALQGRLLDFDDKIRIQAVTVVCELAQANLEFFPLELILQAADRVRDKKVSVRKKAMIKLLELYHAYCIKCSEGLLPITDHFEQIPSKIITLCFDKDCKEFSLQKMELMLAEDLFPASLPAEERVRHWMALFSFFTLPHCKALDSILAQKQRFQREMRTYLSLREIGKSRRGHEKISACFKKMSLSFIDSIKAEECFRKLHQMKDNNIFKALLELVREQSFSNIQSNQEAFLKRIGDKHSNYEFFRVLSLKCAYSIFTVDHVRSILEGLLSKKNEREQYLDTTNFDLLVSIVSIFPTLLRGSEDQFLGLFPMEVEQLNEKLLQMLIRAGGHISIKLRDIYPFLEQACLEGSRIQSKQAVSAMALLMSASDELIFDDLCEKLLGFLNRGQNMPTILQSLGCIAQHSLSSFQLHAEEITQFIIQKIISDVEVRSNFPLLPKVSPFFRSASCKLKIYGLKTLVKSCLPLQVAHGQNQIRGLLDILLKILQEEEIPDGVVEADQAHLRLAAAKSVVRLSTRWDLHISPRLFNLSMALARDPSPVVCRSFLCKINKLLKEQAIPKRYACALALGCCSECLSDTKADALNYLGQFFREYNRRARLTHGSPRQNMDGGALTTFPAYIVVFLIHVLAHDRGFPSADSQDDEYAFASFYSPLIALLQASVNPDFYAGGKLEEVNEMASYLCGIFSAVKRAVDAVDIRFTSKLHRLSEIGLFMVRKVAHNPRPPSHSPRLVLLPSSLYKVNDDARSEQAHLDEGFMERILLRAESFISRSPPPHFRTACSSCSGRDREERGRSPSDGGEEKSRESGGPHEPQEEGGAVLVLFFTVDVETAGENHGSFQNVGARAKAINTHKFHATFFYRFPCYNDF
ncbi:unnamed protein product [Spirodela intermedia]|uniref:Uncharacterized protein n=1 Tax=Spirodela intermedia TaxID=51605 RepID=A0A7I8JBT2_SPIIN|nr:unnamed protein product [Spirodela intermedia]CAA6667666.1 unnamed protein product [Spirodela intermedia]